MEALRAVFHKDLLARKPFASPGSLFDRTEGQWTVVNEQEVIVLIITIDTARRFILGKQGLWPGRRWRGIEGTEAAMRDMEYLQLDPLQIIARSQDIALHSRVLDYTPGLWEELAY